MLIIVKLPIPANLKGGKSLNERKIKSKAFEDDAIV